MTPDERSVTGLQRTNFKIFEDGVPQNILSFSAFDVPVSLGLLIDATDETRDQAQAIALQSLMEGRSPADEFVVGQVGKTPLNDAIYQALNQLLRSKNSNRALVLFTSRNDPDAYPYSMVREFLRSHDVRLYVVAVPGRPDIAGDRALPILSALALLSGGNALFPRSIEATNYRKIAVELRNQYRIGFHSTNSNNDGKWRTLDVTMEPANNTRKVPFTIRAKEGYYASSRVAAPQVKD